MGKLLTPDEAIFELNKRCSLRNDWTEIHKFLHEYYDSMLIEIAEQRSEIRKTLCDTCKERI